MSNDRQEQISEAMASLGLTDEEWDRIPAKVQDMILCATVLEDNDYTLKDGAAWFTVGNRSVRIREDEGILTVGVWPLGAEAEDPIAELRVPVGEEEPS